MSMAIRFVPGLAAAIAAFAVLKLISWLGWASLGGEATAFLATYLVVAITTDRAMQRYGAKGSAGG